MKKMYIVYAIMIFLSIVLSGCLENSNNNDETWTKIEIVGNYTYKIVYEFFSNSSFFSGPWDTTSESYNMSLWGTYSISNERLYLNVGGVFPSNSVHKYSFTDDGKSLILYYEDGVNFDVLTKE
jgi:hypothetical protein